MLETYGDAFKRLRFLVMLRNPVDRAYSAYWMAVRYGWEKRSFDEAVAQCLDVSDGEKYQTNGQFNIHSYIEAGMYYKQLDRWLKVARREQIMLYTQEAMRDSPVAFYKDLSSHLGIELLDHIDFTKQVNKASMPRSRTVMKLTDEKSFIKDILKPFLPQNLRYRLRRAISGGNLKVVQYEPMSEKTRSLLQSVYVEDTIKLRSVIGGDHLCWSSSDAK
jgi:hypothetical protein